MEAKLNQTETVHIGPQPGPQKAFIQCTADIAIYGGSAGGGKTFGLLLDPLRHLHNSQFGGVIFRKTSVQVRNQGGLWDESMELYPLLRAEPKETTLDWKFPSGMTMNFSAIEYDKDVLNWQGSQIPWIGFDELTHFSKKIFFYMLSRNRSTCGAAPRIRGTCNPDPDSWVRELIDWWIGPDGYPIQERSGVIRWFVRINDDLIWGASKQELEQKYGKESYPKSFTFIPSKVTDNKILLNKDPAYISNLNALSRVQRMRLKDGNWNVRESAGSLFRPEWFRVVDAVPSGWTGLCRYWDRAATRPSETNSDPDWTRGLKLYKYPNGTFCVVDLKSIQGTPLEVENLVINTASHDSKGCPVIGEQDPGSAGVSDAQRFARMLVGYQVYLRKPTKDKITRARPVSAQSEAGNILVLRAPWNEVFFNELENFPDGAHDDIVDAFSGAFNELAGTQKSLFEV